MYRKKNREIQVEEVKICEEVEGLYSDKGRPGIDPVSLFKIVFIQYLFGIRSMRRTIFLTANLPTVRKRLATNTASFWILNWEQETYTTDNCSTSFTKKWN